MFFEGKIRSQELIKYNRKIVKNLKNIRIFLSDYVIKICIFYRLKL